MKVPWHVRGETRKVWKRLAPAVGDRLDDSTAASFELLCESVASYLGILAEVEALGAAGLVVYNANGTQSIHPFEKIRHQRHAELVSLCKAWGLTPMTAERAGRVARQTAENRAFEEL